MVPHPTLPDFFSIFTPIAEPNGNIYLDPSRPSQRALIDQAWAESRDRRLWTLVSTPGGVLVAPGLRLVDRLAYLVTEEAWACEDDGFWSPDDTD